MTAKGSYYLPEPSPWPIITSSGLFLLALGLILTINSVGTGHWILLAGAAVVIYMVIGESEAGTYNSQVDMSFRLGMGWFIFSEVMFFAAFFGALFYVRNFSTDWLASGPAHDFLWQNYHGGWPTAGPEGLTPVTGHEAMHGENEFTPMAAWGIPFINTLILLTSGATVTWAHWGLKKDNRAQLITGLFLTVALGLTFLSLQAFEYIHAYTELNLKLTTGVYGSTFFMLTGFHGLHVTLGSIMLMTILGRSVKGHFTPEHHFGFEAVAWYWHFVDVVWLGLFIFVYWL
ncbi:MAG: cytochrome c oxidase subunit 3 [Acidiferrobacteraceae bacterium]